MQICRSKTQLQQRATHQASDGTARADAQLGEVQRPRQVGVVKRQRQRQLATDAVFVCVGVRDDLHGDGAAVPGGCDSSSAVQYVASAASVSCELTDFHEQCL
eukprot:GHRQ01021676.1.p2 GENE.GHRQ01021676.1~~GHRQ01021676.1.p2  ORF type:complete len:103 (+),score=11.21 GHRQ01021676.1:653-961(+)